jgi:hypothetical protein
MCALLPETENREPTYRGALCALSLQKKRHLRAIPLEREDRKLVYCGALCAPFYQKQKTASQCTAARSMRYSSIKAPSVRYPSSEREDRASVYRGALCTLSSRKENRERGALCALYL